MPASINGIGTRYHGKKNLDIRIGNCEKCGRRLKLSTYETRLWFVILFIPIIPLEKKQIFDFCPRCTHHRVMPLKRYESIKKEAIANALQEFQSNPNDPDIAIKTHQTLTAYNRISEADKLMALMEQQFHDHSSLLIYLGAIAEQRGNTDEASRLFEKALKADPENLQARRAVGIGCLQKGELEKAEKLLEFMKTAGPSQDPAVLFLLASAYQKRENHQKALSIFQIILRDFPESAKTDKKLRKAIKISEAGLNRGRLGETILPKKKFVYQKWMAIPLIAVVVIFGIFALNIYLKNNQTLTIINEFPVQASVSVSGHPTVVVPKYSKKEISVAEGVHQVSVKQAKLSEEPFTIDIHNDWMLRFSGGNTFILNVNEGAILFWEETEYSENPNPNATNPYRLYVGNTFMTFRGVDYLFREFPETIKIEGDSAVRKDKLEILSYTPSELLSILLHNDIDPEKIIDYVEAHLNVSSSDTDLLYYYLQLCHLEDAIDRGLSFLESKLEETPLNVEWHRSYQTLYEVTGDLSRLIAMYDRFLEDDPDNSSLVYLRGRIEPDSLTAMRFYDRSIALNRDNAYPHFAKAYHYQSSGEFALAKASCEKAISIDQDQSDYQDFIIDVKFALKEFETLKTSCQAGFENNPSTWQTFRNLIEVQYATNDKMGASNTTDTFQKAVLKESPEDPYQLIINSNIANAYIGGDLDMYETLAKQLNDSEEINSHLQTVAIIRGNMEKAESLMSAPENYNGYDDLLFWLGWEMSGNHSKAEKWLSSASAWFDQQTQSEKQVSRLLDGKETAVMTKLDNLSMGTYQKRILYAAMAYMYPKERKALVQKARKMNYRKSYPHYVLENLLNTL